jgi:hypothetical protein
MSTARCPSNNAVRTAKNSSLEKDRCVLATQVFNAVNVRTESFEVDHIGGDLAYLLAAIVDLSHPGFVDWSKSVMKKRPALYGILKSAFPKRSHLVWFYIQL